jgi:2-amino-4-hydroxy-6-hydroxymethyldihydropteridine diphosphokinase
LTRAFIGIGSNEGDRLAHISRAVQALAATSGIQLVQMALVRETAPVGGPPQHDFLNTAIEIHTTLSPEDLLQALRRIEQAGGRGASRVRNAPRPIDLDVLLYDDCVLRAEALEVPHPRLHERRFVLEPLVDLDAALRHPVLGRTMQELLDAAD